MNWEDVGGWIKDNAGSGAALVGSLLTGNLPGAVAAGISLVSGATGTDDPVKALVSLQNDPQTVVRLRELANQEQDSIRRHISDMKRIELEDRQKEHEEAQKTIRAGDVAEDWFVRRTRPAQSWISLASAVAYVFVNNDPDYMILGALLTLPWAYAGLRQIGKGINSFTLRKNQ
jgi:xanthine/CO dehydrogenase XdhC/CoxF family maturation factor